MITHFMDEIDVLKDIVAMRDFLADVHNDEEVILTELTNLANLDKEFGVAKDSLLETNLSAQETVFDQLMRRYASFQNDVDINGIRLKMLAQLFLDRLIKHGKKDLAKDKKKQWNNLF
jgi:hypothetical protein